MYIVYKQLQIWCPHTTWQSWPGWSHLSDDDTPKKFGEITWILFSLKEWECILRSCSSKWISPSNFQGTHPTPASLYGPAIRHHLPLIRQLGLPFRAFARSLLEESLIDQYVARDVRLAATSTHAADILLKGLVDEGDSNALALFVSFLGREGQHELVRTLSLCPGAACEEDADSYHSFSSRTVSSVVQFEVVKLFVWRSSSHFINTNTTLTKKSLQPRYLWDWSAVRSCDIMRHRLQSATRARDCDAQRPKPLVASMLNPSLISLDITWSNCRSSSWISRL